jgi:hypothetical protein
MSKTKRVLLSERDLRVFNILAKFGYMREDNLAIALGLGDDEKALHVIEVLGARLMRAGYVIRERIFVGTPAYWRLDRDGAALAGCSKQRAIKLMTIRHDDIAHRLAATIIADNKSVTTEHEIKSSLSVQEIKNTKIPDLIVIDESNEVAIEVEVTQKSDAALKVIAERYAASSYQQIMYFSNSRAILNKMYQLTNASNRFKYMIFDELIEESKEYQATNPRQLNNPAQFQPAQAVSLRDKL